MPAAGGLKVGTSFREASPAERGGTSFRKEACPAVAL
jgi:hypothetical protein